MNCHEVEDCAVKCKKECWKPTKRDDLTNKGKCLFGCGCLVVVGSLLLAIVVGVTDCFVHFCTFALSFSCFAHSRTLLLDQQIRARETLEHELRSANSELESLRIERVRYNQNIAQQATDREVSHLLRPTEPTCVGTHPVLYLLIKLFSATSRRKHGNSLIWWTHN